MHDDSLAGDASKDKHTFLKKGIKGKKSKSPKSQSLFLRKRHRNPWLARWLNIEPIVFAISVVLVIGFIALCLRIVLDTRTPAEIEEDNLRAERQKIRGSR